MILTVQVSVGFWCHLVWNGPAAAARGEAPFPTLETERGQERNEEMFYYFQEYTVYKCPFPFEWFSWVSAGRVHVSDLITPLYIEPELCISHYGMKTSSEAIL